MLRPRLSRRRPAIASARSGGRESRAAPTLCIVATPYPGQFTRDDFNALQPFASVNRKLVAAGAEPVRWNALLD